MTLSATLLPNNFTHVNAKGLGIPDRKVGITDKDGRERILGHWLIDAQKHYPLGMMTSHWVSKGRKPYKERGKQGNTVTQETSA